MLDELVSIIVPVFNVENYLKRCVDSLINQTYKNIEIILVNDGSTDKSPEICRKYLQEDQRIRVIDKENGGLSSARNTGIDNCKGKYITFVDSDDWIDIDTIEIAISYIKKYSVDIAVYGIYIENDIKCVKERKIKKSKVLDSNEALVWLNSFKGIDVSACNKMYKREVFKEKRFPIGKLCEDFYTMYKILEDSTIVTIAESKYHYYQRQNSITRNDNINLDYLYAAEEQEVYISNNRPEIKYAGITGLAFAHITMYHIRFAKMIKSNRDEEIKNMKKYSKYIMENKCLPLSRKLQFVVFCYTNKLYDIFLMFKYRIHR